VGSRATVRVRAGVRGRVRVGAKARAKAKVRVRVRVRAALARVRAFYLDDAFRDDTGRRSRSISNTCSGFRRAALRPRSLRPTPPPLLLLELAAAATDDLSTGADGGRPAGYFALSAAAADEFPAVAAVAGLGTAGGGAVLTLPRADEVLPPTCSPIAPSLGACATRTSNPIPA
jgi:hypothetical protein